MTTFGSDASLVQVNDSTFTLENKLIQRVIQFDPKQGLTTTSLVNKATGREYARPIASTEFMLMIDDENFRGYSAALPHMVDGSTTAASQPFTLLGHDVISTSPDSQQLHIKLHAAAKDVTIRVCYEITSDLPAIYKWLHVEAGAKALKLHRVMFEVLNAYPGNMTDIETFTRQGLTRELSFLCTQGSDDILQLHHPDLNEGVLFANAAPGPLKKFLAYPHWQETALCVGYNSDTTPFTCYLQPGESFETDKAITFLYQAQQQDTRMRNTFKEAVRHVLPAYQNDAFMYCTWLPFLKNINEQLLLNLIDKSSALGFSTFVIDDGWFTQNSFEVDRRKFPQDLSYLSEQVRNKNMRFGLWFNIGTTYGDPSAHLQDLCEDSTHQPKGGGFGASFPCKCLASKHRDRMIQKLSELIDQYQVGYFKLDFSTHISPYGVLPVGCHSTSHAYHRNSEDSLHASFVAIAYIRQRLMAKYPDLIIDLSFESFGSDRPHIGALQSSTLHHATNLNTCNPQIYNARTIRHALYDYTTLLPNERILGSLIGLEDQDTIEHLLTSLIGAALLSGDLRKISHKQLPVIQKCMQAVRQLIAQKPLTSFKKLHGDAPAQQDQWDGYARWNQAEKGMVCLFKNNCNAPATFDLKGMEDAHVTALVDVITDERFELQNSAERSNAMTIPWPKDHNCRLLVFA